MAGLIDGLIELAHDPVVQNRKIQLYKLKELKMLGIRRLEDLKPNQQKGLLLLFKKNIGEEYECVDEKSDQDLMKLETRKIVSVGNVFEQ